MKKNAALTGAAFLMATSAIGPGFLTQTAHFTQQLQASFGFVILVSLLLDVGAQVNIWRTVTVTNMWAQDIANRLMPGLGTFLSCLVAFGGLVFNIGNIAGCGLGLEAMTGLDPFIGALVSGLLALLLFWAKEAGRLMDRVTRLLGFLMIGLTLYIAFASAPPMAEAVYRTFWPMQVDAVTIVTLVGGTVVGYISFAGAHRLLDAGISGKAALPQVTRSSISGILLTSLMRYLLFFAALGVVWKGGQLDGHNPAASVFRLAGGNMGMRFFGLVMWCAAITSVVGASYTSASFLKTLHPFLEKNNRVLISGFILFSTSFFLLLGQPVTLLILAGAVNGLILPVALSIVLLAARSGKITGDYRPAGWMQVSGWMVVAAMSWMGAYALAVGWSKLF